MSKRFIFSRGRATSSEPPPVLSPPPPPPTPRYGPSDDELAVREAEVDGIVHTIIHRQLRYGETCGKCGYKAPPEATDIAAAIDRLTAAIERATGGEKP